MLIVILDVLIVRASVCIRQARDDSMCVHTASERASIAIPSVSHVCLLQAIETVHETRELRREERGERREERGERREERGAAQGPQPLQATYSDAC